jgi:predicted metal-dependent hydrolase
MPDYELRVSARRRSLSVEVHPDFRVIVRAPARVDRGMVDAWVAERALWIERQFERFRRMGHERPVPLRHVPGEAHLFLGERYGLEVVAASRAAVTLAGDRLRVAVRGGTPGEPVRRALERWYRERAAELFPQVIAERFDWFAGRGHLPPALAIRAMSSRWGSLAGPGRRAGWFGGRPAAPRRMTLNLALIRAPRACLEYVVVHELCHLEERGHGRGFYRLMDERLPDWRERKARLEKSGVLMA